MTNPVEGTVCASANKEKGRRLSWVLHHVGNAVGWLSFEVLLTRTRRANGGTIILVRAFLTALLLYALAIAFKHGVDPMRTSEFSWLELRLELSRSFQWFGAIFAAVYVALYARFAAQWTYLANLYNQIKQAEARAAEKGNDAAVAQKLCEWKAGFLEDAEVLHLSTKPVFASVISAWSRDRGVQICYVALTPGGRVRLPSLLADVKRSCEREARKWTEIARDQETLLLEDDTLTGSDTKG